MEKDLGVLVCSRFSLAAAAMANKILSCIKRAMDGREVNIIMPLNKALVRPHLEYGIQFWTPLLRKDIMEHNYGENAEMSHQINEGDNLSYEERLAKLDVFTLEKRRLETSSDVIGNGGLERELQAPSQE
ncbi:hypothetical protein FKM82_027736 [Ascaphus truei]